MNSRSHSGGAFSLIMGLIFVGLLLYVVFFSISGIFMLLSRIAPFLLVATAIINFGVIRDYVTMVVDKLRNNVAVGLLYLIGSLVFYPAVAGFLFYRSLSGSRKKKHTKKNKKKQRETGEYIPFEEVKDDDTPLDFEEMRNQKKSFEELFQEKEERS